ncbi:hypothetical protein AVMA1855_19990 [Acidovorax sp. SUPP1855]|uniref:hypothetical protein n=1 Tax=Acidovorax sp. SUPP1855 TaxID=431774 RepID=UPI0023DE66A7|nr:hypothetical protein [Acidovorax sp. SUPP1855]GKS86472.1 hypothetical protein AVMA1855_19990 [Acidovorax sp. SUPP1855]
MTGLLDFLASPESQLGIGLLAAANSGMGLGQGLLSATQSVAAQHRAGLQDKYLQSQVEENASQAELRKQQLQMAQQKQNMLAGLLGGPGGLPLATTSGGLNVPSGGGSGIENMSPNQIAALKANGIDLESIWKTSKEGFKRDAGAYYEDVNGGQRFFPQLDRGMAISNGQVVQAPGYAQANAAIKGQEAGAVEAAKYPFAVGADAARQNLAASLDTVEVFNPTTGRKEIIPRAVAVGGMRPSSTPAGIPSGYAGGSRDAATQEQILMVQNELSKLPANHPDRPALSREIARLQGMGPRDQAGSGQSGNFSVSPSAAEDAAAAAARTRATKTAEADVDRDTAAQKKTKSAGEMIAATKRARELLLQGPTGSGIGEMVDKGAAFFGRSTKGGEVSAKLDIVAGDLVSNVPRMEGPQSDGDRLEYKLQAGRAADRSLPANVRLAAMDEVERLQSKYAPLNGGTSNQGGAEGSWDAPSKPSAGGFRIIGVQ